MLAGSRPLSVCSSAKTQDAIRDLESITLNSNNHIMPFLSDFFKILFGVESIQFTCTTALLLLFRSNQSITEESTSANWLLIHYAKITLFLFLKCSTIVLLSPYFLTGRHKFCLYEKNVRDRNNFRAVTSLDFSHLSCLSRFLPTLRFLRLTAHRKGIY